MEAHPYDCESVCGSSIVATSQPLATEAGLIMIRQGGNAVDAALAAAICLTVVEPTSNGLGSDAFAIVHDGEQLAGLNGSGRSPAAWNHNRFQHLFAMPEMGWDSVTVPGAVSTWAALSGRFGKLPFEKLFEPAIKHATNGFIVTPIIAAGWQLAEDRFEGFPAFRETFLPGGRAPRAGERFACGDLAASLHEIAMTRGESFYRGPLADKMIETSSADGGLMTIDDLADHQPFWIDPISMKYRDYRLHEIPPNGQGLAALVALGILDQFDLSDRGPNLADTVHLQVEVMKFGLADIATHLADPECLRTDLESLLDPDRLKKLTEQIDMQTAKFPEASLPEEQGTVCLVTADGDGMMVSFIQSNYMGFGSGVVIPGTGITMQNRGHGFSLIKGHPNQVDGHKLPYHTIIPGLVTKDNQPLLAFGLMGGHMQAQGHLQIMSRLFDYGMSPQEASNAPRWYLTKDHELALEPGFSSSMIAELSLRGHTISATLPVSTFGGAQLILREGDQYSAGSDHRKDGCAAAL